MPVRYKTDVFERTKVFYRSPECVATPMIQAGRPTPPRLPVSKMEKKTTRAKREGTLGATAVKPEEEEAEQGFRGIHTRIVERTMGAKCRPEKNVNTLEIRKNTWEKNSKQCGNLIDLKSPHSFTPLA